ncbi:MAG: GNAT family N-acetyltransferase [Pseudomonadota bacterium]|nr:GNAT family N-acetyltransferase [Pseudomonadota bacterium]
MSPISCERMKVGTRSDASRLLGSFLADDVHYRASSSPYGDGGHEALERALDLFVARPELGFVWLAFCDCQNDDPDARTAMGACVVCYGISTSRGAVVAKLDDVTVRAGGHGRGIGTVMLRELARELQRQGIRRIDTACHRDNTAAWRFYERLGFKPLDEERIALVL